MALLVGFSFLLIGRVLGRRRAVIPVMVVVGGYAMLVGGDAAVVRAALMGGLVVLAIGLRRRSTALVSLAVACWVMTLANPAALWDVGFQLSVAATVGLIEVTPPIWAILRYLWPTLPGGLLADDTSEEFESGNGQSELDWTNFTIHRLLYGLVVESAVITVGANIAVMPLLAYHFYRVSLLGMVANLLIVPVQPAIMAWGSAGVILGAAGLIELAQVLLWVPWLGFYWTVAVVERIAQIRGASIALGDFGRLAVLLSYTVIFGVLWRGQWWSWLKVAYDAMTEQPAARHNASGSAPGRALGWLGGVLGICTILVWWAVFMLPDGRLHVWFLDVGQGDGIFIQTPSGRQVLIDGGRSAQVLFSELGAVMPFWDRSLDLMVLTHPDGDHMNGQIEAPSRFQIERAIDTADQVNSEGALWRDSLDNAQVPVVVMGAGGWVDLGDGVALWGLWPSMGDVGGDTSDNENSLVLKLVYGDFSILLTGDVGLASEAMLLRANAPLGATVLKVGHHGSAGSTSQEFVAAVNPAVAVIQVGADNTYGHPDQEVLENLAGRRILRNDVHGRIHIYSDGAEMWLEPEQRD